MDSNAIGDKPSSCPLDKPLAELTEDDIVQLTREDCRNFLKRKGMRRPSWNKSQAIQQVISLKALIEGRPGGDDCPAGPGILMKPQPELPPGSAADATASLSGNSSQIAAPSVSGERGGRESQSPPQKVPCAAPYRRRDPAPRILIVGRDNLFSDSQRVATRVPTGQMTIFYEGRINVFEGVMQEQARTIMEVASSSRWPADDVASLKLTSSPLPSTKSVGNGTHSTKDALNDGIPLRDIEPEGLSTRKASLQRYLEKRKDRFKGKRMNNGSAPSSLEMLCLSQKFRCQNANESVGGTEKSSVLPQPPGTPARCSPVENRNQRIRLSIDLNSDGGGE